MSNTIYMWLDSDERQYKYVRELFTDFLDDATPPTDTEWVVQSSKSYTVESLLEDYREAVSELTAETEWTEGLFHNLLYDAVTYDDVMEAVELIAGDISEKYINEWGNETDE